MKEWKKENLCRHYFTASLKNLQSSSAENPIRSQLCFLRSRNTVVGILSALGAGRSGIRFLTRKRDFSILRKGTDLLWPTQPAIDWVTGAFSPGAEWPGNMADYSYTHNDEVKNEWSSIPTTLYAFMSCTGKTLPFHIYQFFFLTLAAVDPLGGLHPAPSNLPRCKTHS